MAGGGEWEWGAHKSVNAGLTVAAWAISAVIAVRALYLFRCFRRCVAHGDPCRTPLRYVNRPNKLMLMVCAARLLQATGQAAVALGSLILHRHGPCGIPPLLCDVSATVEQFFDATSLTLMVGFFANVAFPKFLVQDGARRRALWVGWAHIVACSTVAGMWALLQVSTHGTRFGWSLSWCWIPDDTDAAVRVGGPWTVELLRAVCSYGAVPVLLVLGTAALLRLLVNIRAALSSVDNDGDGSTALSPEAHIACRRVVPQLVWYVVLTTVAGASRFFKEADDDGFEAALSFAIPLTAAVTTLLWAYGEGLLLVLLLGRSHLESALTYESPFSLTACKVLGLPSGAVQPVTRASQPAAVARESEDLEDYHHLPGSEPLHSEVWLHSASHLRDV